MAKCFFLSVSFKKYISIHFIIFISSNRDQQKIKGIMKSMLQIGLIVLIVGYYFIVEYLP
jgi:hypothetical protein